MAQGRHARPETITEPVPVTAGTKAIVAAGGVVWRTTAEPAADQVPHVALVHRPRYDDWTLPKGKLAKDEHPLAGALREVREETGATVSAGRRLTSVQYVAEQAVKRVHYWSLRYLTGDHEASREVDEIEWLPAELALARLSYPTDRTVLQDFLTHPADSTTVVLVRHARAGKRSGYRGDDRLRPLDKIGRRQARDMVAALSAFAPDQVLSVDRTRCQDTVIPLAEHLGLKVEVLPGLTDEEFQADPQGAVERVYDLLRRPAATLVCSQGVAIPGILTSLGATDARPPCRKGSAWAVTMAGGSLVAADYYPHPGY